MIYISIIVLFVSLFTMASHSLIFNTLSYFDINIVDSLLYSFIHYFILPVSGFFTFLIIAPIMMPRITISNGEKTVIWQGMVHLAKKKFYDRLWGEIIFFRNNNYSIFYEGVGFKERLKENDLKYGYSKANILNVVKQPECLGNLSSLDTVADFSIDEFKTALYDNLIKRGYSPEYSTFLVDNFKESKSIVMDKHLLQGGFLFYFLIKLIYIKESFSWLIDNNKIFSMKKEKKNKKNNIKNNIEELKKAKEKGNIKWYNFLLFGMVMNADVVIHQRDELLKRHIIEHKNNNIFITYGKGHMPGVFKRLKEADNRWKIINISFRKAL